MALNTAYDSKINRHFNKADLILAIEKGHHTAENTPSMMGDSVKLITENYEVTPLPYPLYDGESKVVYADVRTCSGLTRDGELKVRNQVEFDFLEVLSKLELHWTSVDKTSSLQSLYSYSSDIFVNWLTEVIGHRLGLSPIHTMRLRAVTAFYAIGLFDNHPDKKDMERYCALLSRKFAVPIDVAFEVLDAIDEIPVDVDTYISAMQRAELGTRVKDFTSRALFNFLNGSFFGVSNPISFVGVAVEYPPAFAAICTITEKYRFTAKSGIGQKVQETNKRNRSTVEKSLKAIL